MESTAASRQEPGCRDREVRGPSAQAEREGTEVEEGESSGVCCLSLSVPSDLGLRWTAARLVVHNGVMGESYRENTEHCSGFGCCKRRGAA